MTPCHERHRTQKPRNVGTFPSVDSFRVDWQLTSDWHSPILFPMTTGNTETDTAACRVFGTGENSTTSDAPTGAVVSDGGVDVEGCAICGAFPEITGAPGPYLGRPLCESCGELAAIDDGRTTLTLAGHVETYVDCGEHGAVRVTGQCGVGLVLTDVEQEPTGPGRPWLEEPEVALAWALDDATAALERMGRGLGALRAAREMRGAA